MLVGATHIDHADRLRAGSTNRVLPFRVMAPSTLGTFLRSFTWGHVRQLDRTLGETLRRAWTLGGSPENTPVTIDVDSTICEVTSKSKHGASYGYTHRLGYHPLIAARADTGEIVHARLRGGSSQKGATHFVAETINRIRRAGATGPVTLRADAGFWSYEMIERLDRLGVKWSITVPLYSQVRQAIENIEETAWASIDYPPDGVAQVAETTFRASSKGDNRLIRLVVRRTRLTDPEQAQLWPDWRHHAFATNTGTRDGQRRPRSPGTRPRRTRHPGPQRISRSRASPIRELLRQRRLAFLRHPGAQPLPLDQPPQRGPTRRTVGQRAHRPYPSPVPTRTARQPQRSDHPTTAHPMAMGHHHPYHPHQHPQPPPTLLNPPLTHQPLSTSSPAPEPNSPTHTQTATTPPTTIRTTAKTQPAPPVTPLFSTHPHHHPTHQHQNGGLRLRGCQDRRQ